ncbi:MAG: alpha/beta hydrolase, partial [Paracoccaceae bacterium]
EILSLLGQALSTVTLENRININYVRYGEGKPLVFIHGAMGDWRSAAPQWDFFTKHFDCLTYSRRYSYPNANPLNDFNHSALVDADDLLQLLDYLKIQKAILVGSSYGGFTALALAVKAKDRVTAVISVEAPMMKYAQNTNKNRKIIDDFLLRADEPARRAFENGDDEQGVRILTGGIIGRPPNKIPDDLVHRRMQNLNAAKSLSLSQDEFPLISPKELHSLTMPILLIRGSQTEAIHKVIFNSVSAEMPHADKVVIEGSGHSVSQQAPEKFNETVLNFLHEKLT